MLLIAKWALFSDIMAKVWYIRLYDTNVRFVLYQYPYLDFLSASSLKQPSAGRHVVAFDTDTLFRVLTNQSLHFFLNAVCLAEKQQIANLCVFGLILRGSNSRYHALLVSTFLEVIQLFENGGCILLS